MKRRLVEIAIGFAIMAVAGWLFGAMGAIIAMIALVVLMIF